MTNMTTFKLKAEQDHKNLRLDKALSLMLPEISRSQIQKSIKTDLVRVNNVIISDSSIKVKENDELSITIKETEGTEMLPAAIDIEIVYEDRDLIVVNKPAGLTTHPGAGNHQDTLANALLYHADSLSDAGGSIRPGIVHRLDKDTSGLMVVAKNNLAHASLAEQIQARELTRQYKALVWGVMTPTSGTISGNIGRSRSDRTKMTILKFGGKNATTHYTTKEIYRNGFISLVICTLDTGRTHQIRLHMSHAGHSVLGDQTYGANSRKLVGCPPSIREVLAQLKRQALHSYYIKFTHPTTKKVLEFASVLPCDMQTVIDALRDAAK